MAGFLTFAALLGVIVMCVAASYAFSVFLTLAIEYSSRRDY